jgi:hypothetical protein
MPAGAFEQQRIGALGVLDATGAMLYRKPNGKVTAVVPGDLNNVLTLIDDGAGNLIPDWRSSSLAVQASLFFAPEDAIYDQVTVDGVGPVDNPKPAAVNTRPAMGFRTGATTAANEGISWQTAMPQDYDGGDVTVKVYWAPDGTSVDSVAWQVAMERVSPAAMDLATDGFDTPTAAVLDVGTGTADELVITTIPLAAADMDGVLAGEPFRFYLQRNNDVGTVDPNSPDDANVVRVTFIEDAVAPAP